MLTRVRSDRRVIDTPVPATARRREGVPVASPRSWVWRGRWVMGKGARTAMTAWKHLRKLPPSLFAFVASVAGVVTGLGWMFGAPFRGALLFGVIVAGITGVFLAAYVELASRHDDGPRWRHYYEP